MTEADARLIADAPNMLAALKELLATHSSEWDEEGLYIHNSEGWLGARKRAVAIIKRLETTP